MAEELTGLPELPSSLNLGGPVTYSAEVQAGLDQFPLRLGLNDGERSRVFFIYEPYDHRVPDLSFISSCFLAAQNRGALPDRAHNLASSVYYLKSIQPGDVLFYFEGHAELISAFVRENPGALQGCYLHPLVTGRVAAEMIVILAVSWGVDLNHIHPIHFSRTFGMSSGAPIVEAGAIEKSLRRFYLP